MILKYTLSEEYIILEDVMNLLELDQLISKSIYDPIFVETLNIGSFLLEYNHSNEEQVKTIALKKNHILAEWIIQNTDGKTIINNGPYISYHNVINALLATIFENNDKMANKVTALFLKRISGSKKDLMAKNNSEEVLNYIIDHFNFKVYSEITDIENEKIVNNFTSYIDYDKIVNALLIAISENNAKMANKIMLLLLYGGKEIASREELLKENYSEKVLDYILSNCNFKEYLKLKGREESEKCLIYEKKTS